MTANSIWYISADAHINPFIVWDLHSRPQNIITCSMWSTQQAMYLMLFLENYIYGS